MWNYLIKYNIKELLMKIDWDETCIKTKGRWWVGQSIVARNLGVGAITATQIPDSDHFMFQPVIDYLDTNQKDYLVHSSVQLINASVAYNVSNLT